MHKRNPNFNMDTQPAWGPTGYDYVENYYLPDLDVYYNVPQHRFYCIDNGRWISSYNLPHRYQGSDLYNSYKVVINEKDPWRNDSGYRENIQNIETVMISSQSGIAKDTKYFQNKYHPEHNNWVKQQKHNNGNQISNSNKKNNNKKNNKQNRDKR